MKLHIENLHVTLHAPQQQPAGLLADNQRLRETARRLVDVMERSDLEQFENAQPVSGEEWFGAIREAKGMLA